MCKAQGIKRKTFQYPNNQWSSWGTEQCSQSVLPVIITSWFMAIQTHVSKQLARAWALEMPSPAILHSIFHNHDLLSVTEQHVGCERLLSRQLGYALVIGGRRVLVKGFQPNAPSVNDADGRKGHIKYLGCLHNKSPSACNSSPHQSAPIVCSTMSGTRQATRHFDGKLMHRIDTQPYCQVWYVHHRAGSKKKQNHLIGSGKVGTVLVTTDCEVGKIYCSKMARPTRLTMLL